MGAIHTTKCIRDPPHRGRRKFPRIKMDCEGKVVTVALQGGVGAAANRMQGSLGHRSVSQPGGQGVRQDTKGKTGRWVKDRGQERVWEKERDRWRCEGGSGISTREELCFRSFRPEIQFVSM